MRVNYSIAILLGCIVIQHIDAFTSPNTLVKLKQRQQRYEIIMSNFQEERTYRPIHQKIIATSGKTSTLEISSLSQEITQWTESFLSLIPIARPETTLSIHLIHLIFTILTNTREAILEHSQDDSPLLDSLLNMIQQADAIISDPLAEKKRALARTTFLSKRRVSSQGEDGEEGDEQHHHGKHGDNEEGDDKGRHGDNEKGEHHGHEQDNQDGDGHRGSKHGEEGGHEDGKEGDDNNRAHDTAKMKRQLSSLVNEIYIALDQVCDYVYLESQQDDLHIHLNNFIVLIYQTIKELNT